MPPKKRTTKTTAAKKEQETKLKVLLADFDEKCKVRRLEIERTAMSMRKQVNTYTVQELFKLPKAARDMKFEALLAGEGNSLPDSLNKIEEEINKAIQLPVIGRKVRTATKANPTPMLPPVPPTKSTTRKKRLNTNSVDMENAAASNVIKNEDNTLAVPKVEPLQPSVVARTPLVENPSKSPAINDRTFDFDSSVPPDSTGEGSSQEINDETRTIPKTADLDKTRTIKKGMADENREEMIIRTIATAARKPVPNELLWSERGSPVVIDPRTALALKSHTPIVVSQGKVTLTDSPLTDEESKRLQLNQTDMSLMKNVYQKLGKLLGFGNSEANGDSDEASASSSKH